MAKNNKFWKTLLAGSDDKKHAAQTGEDPLEEGLKDLTWFESSSVQSREVSTRHMRHSVKKSATRSLPVSLSFIFWDYFPLLQ